MKKAVSLILAIVLCLGMCACGSNNSNSTTTGTTTGTNSNIDSHPKATIINNDGKTENLTAADLRKLNNGNQVAFNKKYIGAQVTLIAKVVKVHGKTVYNGHSMAAYVELEDGWLVEASSSKVVEDLMPGDYVIVTGQIYLVSMDIQLFITSNATTTIRPYNG